SEHARRRGLSAPDARRRGKLPERGVSARRPLRQRRPRGPALPVSVPPQPFRARPPPRRPGQPEPPPPRPARRRGPQRRRGVGPLPELPARPRAQGARRMNALLDWLDNRTGYRGLLKEALYERIPGGARWRYVWGSTLTFALAVQFITGVI